MTYYADRERHLVCSPNTEEALLAMAAELGIGPHWLHRGQHPHIDIPVKQVARILADPRVEVVHSRAILGLAPGWVRCAAPKAEL